MTGGTNPKAPSSSSSHKNNINNNKSSSSSSSHRKSRWENPNNNNNNNNNNKFVADSNKSEKPQTSIVTPKGKDSLLGPGPSKPSSDSIPPLTPLPPPPPPPSGPQFPDPVAVAGFAPPPPAPAPAPAAAYGFQMLDRRSITLADSSVRSYFALPPDYQDFAPPIRPFDRERERERERDRFLPFGGPTFGLERHFPPGGGGRMSPPDRPYERAHDRLNEREENYGRGGQSDYWKSLGLDARVPESSQKRKFGEEDGEEREGRDKFAWHRQQLLQYGNPNSNTSNNDYLAGTSSSPFRRDPFEDMRSSSRQMRVSGDYDLGSRREANLSHPDVDPKALKNAFLKYVKSVFENKEKYLEDKKQRPLECVACGRDSKEFPDMHILVMHAFNCPDSRVEHLGLHKALCVLMGWSYAKVPDHSKGYRSLSAEEAAVNKEDLIMWPPIVIIHNTSIGRGKDGRMEGMGNKMMDNKLKDLGFGGGKSKSVFGKEGHQGVTLVKFADDKLGLMEALRLVEHFEKENHGLKGWARALSSQSGRDEENNPYLVKIDEKTGEKKKIYYGYLGTASDLEKVDNDTRKRCDIESRREMMR